MKKMVKREMAKVAENIPVVVPKGEKKDEIVVYQPDAVVRLEVRILDESVWLTQAQIAELFGTKRPAITKHLANIYKCGELEKEGTCSILEHMGHDGAQQYRTAYYNLDAILAVGYRVNSREATQFRRWASSVLKEYLLRGYAFNARMNQLEDKMDRRLAKHDADIIDLREKVEFFVKTSTPPLQGVFYDGQIWDAFVLAEKLVASAKKSIFLIDNWATETTLDMLSKKRKGVSVTVVTSQHFDRKSHQPHHKILPTDIAKFNAQYPKLDVRFSENFHDRFLILDDVEIYLIGASLKDLGRKCFAFTKLDASEIPGLKARA